MHHLYGTYNLVLLWGVLNFLRIFSLEFFRFLENFYLLRLFFFLAMFYNFFKIHSNVLPSTNRDFLNVIFYFTL